MTVLKKIAAGSVFSGALLVGVGFGLANSAPQAQNVVGDGKLDVTVTVAGQEIGIMRDVTLGQATSLTASACPKAGIDEPALSRLDTSGTALPGACNVGAVGGMSFTFSQNQPAPGAPTR